MTTPTKIDAGLTAAWVLETPLYPAADGWTIQYEMVNAAEHISFSSTTEDGRHKVIVSAATTGAWTPGEYMFQAVAVKGLEKYLVEGGSVIVVPSFSESFDARPHCKKVLDAVEALLEGKAGKDVAKYIIGSRRLDHYTFPELLVLRDKYQAEWRRWQQGEKLRQGIGGGGNVLVRF